MIIFMSDNKQQPCWGYSQLHHSIPHISVCASLRIHVPKRTYLNFKTLDWIRKAFIVPYPVPDSTCLTSRDMRT